MVEELPQEDIKKDSTLEVYEGITKYYFVAKWKAKIEEIKEDFKKIKRRKE